MDDPGSIILYLALLVSSAYFSGTEISLASVNRIHIMSMSAKGSKAADRVLSILDNFDEALSVLLIGNNIVNIGCATLTVVIVNDIWKNSATAISIATVATTIIIFIFGEMLPKCFARSCNEKFALYAAGILLVLMKFLKPFSIFFTALSRAVSKPFKSISQSDVTVTVDELHDIVENISDEDDFDEEKGKLVKSALHFSNATVDQILTAWDDVLKIQTSMKTSEILEIIKTTRHSRIPVVDRRGNVKGILQIRKFIKSYLKSGHNVVLSSVIDYPYFVKSNIIIDDLLSDMSNHKRNLA
ncbi:MAG: DUF21 domain-containing protein, partial [Clostridia bacterium]|nr:DUF21 domain-containing protein [Clostridia bacterium]